MGIVLEKDKDLEEDIASTFKDNKAKFEDVANKLYEAGDKIYFNHYGGFQDFLKQLIPDTENNTTAENIEDKDIFSIQVSKTKTELYYHIEGEGVCLGAIRIEPYTTRIGE